MKNTLRVLGALLAVFAWFFLTSGGAAAHVGHNKQRPKLELAKRAEKPADGPRGKAQVDASSIRLERQADGSYVAGFELKNSGDGPLQVFRVAVRADDDGPIPPQGLGVQTLPRGTPFIPPGQSRLYNVVWRADQTLAKQVFGELQIDTDGATPGATDFDPSLALAISAEARPLWQRPLLPLLTFLPLLAGLLAFASRFVPRLAVDRHQRSLGIVCGLLAVAASLVLLAGFSRGIGMDDGNDGLQHITHAVVAGLPFFVALDGVAASLLPVPLILCTALMLAAPAGQARRLLMLAGPAATGGVLLLTAQSLELSALAFVLAAAPAAWLLLPARAQGSRYSVGELVKALAGPTVASAAFLAATHLLSGGALSTGHVAFGLTDLGRALLEHAPEASLPLVFGQPFANGIALAMLVAGTVLLGVVPFFGAVIDTSERGDAGASGFVGGLFGVLGVYVVLRFALFLAPGEAAKLAPALLVLGGLTTLAGVARGLASRDIRTIAASTSTALGGLAVAALASMTPQGFQAALTLIVVRAVAGMLLSLLADALVRRTGDVQITSYGGVLASAPLLSACLALALLSLGPIPGGAGFWGALLALLGMLGRTPAWAILFVFATLATLLPALKLLPVLGRKPAAAWKSAATLEPHGGVVFDLRSGRERSWALLLVGALLFATFGFRFWIGMSNQAIIDLLPQFDPPGATQVAGAARAADGWRTRAA